LPAIAIAFFSEAQPLAVTASVVADEGPGASANAILALFAAAAKEVERVEDLCLRAFGSATLDHRDRFGGAGDDEADVGGVDDVLGGVDVPRPAGADDANAGHGARVRGGRDRERSGRAAQGEHVGLNLAVVGHERADDLHLVPEALREHRADGTVDQAADQRLAFGRTTFALEEPAGDRAVGARAVHVVDRERQEVEGAGRGCDAGRAEEVGVTATDDDSVRLLGELARLEGEGAAADFDGLRDDGVLVEREAHGELLGAWPRVPALHGDARSALTDLLRAAAGAGLLVPTGEDAWDAHPGKRVD
jgi:hypothetical protein